MARSSPSSAHIAALPLLREEARLCSSEYPRIFARLPWFRRHSSARPGNASHGQPSRVKAASSLASKRAPDFIHGADRHSLQAPLRDRRSDHVAVEIGAQRFCLGVADPEKALGRDSLLEPGCFTFKVGASSEKRLYEVEVLFQSLGTLDVLVCRKLDFEARGCADHRNAHTRPITKLLQCRRQASPHASPMAKEFPSGSLKIAEVPQDSFLGGCTNSTPRSTNSRYVFSTSSTAKDMFWKVPIRDS